MTLDRNVQIYPYYCVLFVYMYLYERINCISYIWQSVLGEDHRICLILIIICRLNPCNSHQLPMAVILCGLSRSGVVGLATARHLASHGVRTIVYIPDLPLYPPEIAKEFKLYKLTAQKWTTNAKCKFHDFSQKLQLLIHQTTHSHDLLTYLAKGEKLIIIFIHGVRTYVLKTEPLKTKQTTALLEAWWVIKFL